jgi:predicted ATPase
MAIQTPDRRLRVFVSSTLAELADERRAVSRAISALRLTPVMFEWGARPHPPRDLYRAYLAQSDVFIGLYWQLYGRIGPDLEISALEEEYQLSVTLPHLLYVKEPAPDREPRLTELLSRVKQEVSYRRFQTTEELSRLVRDDLASLLSEQFVASRRGADGPPAEGSLEQPPRPLPAAATSLIGRDRAIDDVAALMEVPGVRLVTLTGPGGVGKTRLAIAAGARLRERFGAGTAFVPLAEAAEPEAVLTSIGRGVGADLAGAAPPLQAVVERLGDRQWLLVLDNFEQALDAARDVDELLARCPGVSILATSRFALRLRAEREYPVPPLTLPPDPDGVSIEELASSPSVMLFVDRAQAVRSDFAITQSNAAAVVEICRRLEGLPLAIELAAARIRLLEPDAILGRLATSLDALGTGTVDMPARQRTLRATVNWSVDLLDDAERMLLETASVFVDGWTIGAAAAVTGIDEDRTLDMSEELARHSLITFDITDRGPRARMLETVRAFVAERLGARPDVEEIRRRHAEFYRSLAQRADRPLRTTGHGEWLERLEIETGNLAATVQWYLGHDPGQVPHTLRSLWLFWQQQEHLLQIQPLVEQLLPTAGSLVPLARAELLWIAVATAADLGDDDAAVTAGRQLAPLLAEIDDPVLEAVAHLSIAWTLPILGDFEAARQGALAALDQLRALDEPYWTAIAAVSTGNIEVALARYDDSLVRFEEARELADGFDYRWMAATSRAQIGTVAVLQGRLEEGRQVLEEGLALGVNKVRTVAQFLNGFARLALAIDEPERAALLAGAADGLRRRIGLQLWPMQRRSAARSSAQGSPRIQADGRCLHRRLEARSGPGAGRRPGWARAAGESLTYRGSVKASFQSRISHARTTPLITNGSPATNSSAASRVVNTDIDPCV